MEHHLNRFRSMYFHTDGKIYIGTWGWGMLVYNPETDSFYVPAIHSKDKSNKEVINAGVESFFPKNDKNIFVDFGTGLYLFNVEDKSWKLLKMNDLKSEKQISYGVDYIDSKGRIWNGINHGFSSLIR